MRLRKLINKADGETEQEKLAKVKAEMIAGLIRNLQGKRPGATKHEAIEAAWAATGRMKPDLDVIASSVQSVQAFDLSSVQVFEDVRGDRVAKRNSHAEASADRLARRLARDPIDMCINNATQITKKEAALTA